MKHLSPEYNLIKSWYGSKRAERSKVPLINHIDEGIEMMRTMGASQIAIKAFCLHPLAQSESPVADEVIRHTPYLNREAVYLAKQYAIKANSYLCRPETDHYTIDDLPKVVGYLSQDLIHMLVADKIQNEKDFELYHKATHPRSKQLANYFCLWLDHLENVEAFIKGIDK